KGFALSPLALRAKVYLALSQKQFEFNLQFVFHFDCSAAQLDRFNAETRLREFRMSRRSICCIRQTIQRDSDHYGVSFSTDRQVTVDKKSVCFARSFDGC